jgi:rRNA maturation RNase YbeY
MKASNFTPSEKKKSTVQYFEEDIRYRFRNKRKTAGWIRKSIQNEGKVAGEINIIFCSDEYLHRMNVDYLDHDTYTDIITFDMSEEENLITGEIFISVERAKENARNLGVRMTGEVRRLIIHGILHLLGYGDKSGEEKEVMTRKEDYYLSLHP